MSSFLDAARMRGAGGNSGLARGGWRVTARIPHKPYEPLLKDVYPRNEYTMMPAHNAPKYYTGHFMKFDYKDAPKPPESFNEGRPVVFKKQDIEYVQTKKKYGQNLKGESSVALHLCNDTNSLLYQRSLQPDARDRARSNAGSSYSTGIYTPFAIRKQAKNETSALNSIKHNDPLEAWLNTKYPTTNRRRLNTGDSRSTLHGLDSEFDTTSNAERYPRTIQTAPEWYSDFFPRQRVADAMKFMGSAKPSFRSARNKEFDVNFNGVY